MSHRRLRIGTRGSQLAKTQSGMVADQLERAGFPCELVEISTQADRSTAPIASLGTQGVFTKEIQEALLRREVDLAVHSLKDLPTQLPDGLIIAATPLRAQVGDAVVARSGGRIWDLPAGARIGTGSPRRRAQLWAVRPDFELCELRGNVDTRIRKLRAGEYDAIILAAAGLERLGCLAEVTEILSPDEMLPAIGQGALALEACTDNHDAIHAAQSLHDPITYAAVLAERTLLATLQGGCLAPVAAWARQERPGGPLRLTARVLHPRGTPHLRIDSEDQVERAEWLGRSAAQTLLEQGAAELVQSAKEGA